MFKEKEIKSINYFWHIGDIEKIKEYYKASENYKYNFYATSDIEKFRVVHSGLPAIISNTITGLIGINDITIETKNEQDRVLIDEFYKTNDVLDKLNTSIKNLTWSGECFVKFNSYRDDEENLTFDLEVINPLWAKVFYEHGQVIGYDFIVYENEQQTKRTIEHYGKGFIERRYEEKKETDGDDDDTWEIVQIYRTVFSSNEIFATHAFIADDAYSKSLQIFDALDENYSRMPNEEREGRMVKFVDSRLLEVDERGNVIKENGAGLKNFITLQGFQTEDGKPLIENFMADIDPDKRYLKSKEQYTKDAIRNAGLSFHTYAGGEIKANISSQSQREIEKVSIRTRKEYINSLKKFVQKIFELFLYLSSKNVSWLEMTDENKNETIAIVKNEFEVVISFNDYIQNSIENRIKIWGSIEAKETFPLKFRIEKILENELNEADIDKLVAAFKQEEGVYDENTNEIEE